MDEADIYDVTVTDATRRLATDPQERRRELRPDILGGAVPGVRTFARALSSASATVTFKVQMDVDSSTFIDSSDLYSSITSDLSDADSDSTDLVSAIQSASSTEIFTSIDVEATSTVLITRPPSAAPTSNPTSAPTTAPVAASGGGGGGSDDDGGAGDMGLYIGLGISIPLLGAGAWYGYTISQNGLMRTKSVKEWSDTIKEDIGDVSTGDVGSAGGHGVELPSTLTVQGATVHV